MNILYYIPSISEASGGLYQYSIALIELLIKEKKNCFFIYSLSSVPIDLLRLESKNENLNIIPQQVKKTSSFTYKFNRLKEELNSLLNKAGIKWFRLKYRYKINTLIDKYSIDILHCPYDQLPFNMNVPSISTIHDLQELHFPQYFTPDQRIERAINKNHLVNDSDIIICSYDHIRKDLEKFFPDSQSKVFVCLIEMENLWFNKYKESDVQKLDEFDIKGDFILYPAATWEHKNHFNLVKAFKNLLKETGKELTLVCTGRKTNFFYESIEPLLSETNTYKSVKFTGIVEDIQLYSLYKQCKAVVVPSIYEAGSFPLMESILMEVPVICSNVTSLPDTIGDLSYTFNPHDIEEIKLKIKDIISNETFIESNLNNSLKRRDYLTNTKAIDIMNEVYSKAILR